MRMKHRAATLGLSIVGSVVNFSVAIHVLSFWRVLKWESESEWEGTTDGWRVDSIKLIWMLLCAYFTTASVVCGIGAVGVIKRTPSFVRLYRDYSLADIVFCGLLTVVTALVSFRPAARAIVCEEISGQPELLRDLAEAGLNPEDCEQWFEHAAVGFVGIAAILLVVRLQFLFTVSSFYKQLIRQHIYGSIELSESDVDDDGSPQRIFLLPARTKQDMSSGSRMGLDYARDCSDVNAVLVYAPVSLNSLSESEARELGSSEAWVSHAPEHTQARHHRHSHSHSHSYSHSPRSHRHSHNQTSSHGRIGLSILAEEGLLPSYSESADFKV
ncbi:hypothetical protein EW145_g340 [Phellinidium pouzarii]|uniref:Uncharacterized protein n=1 Tax=Phellinidium pouzarii TaxID=167371 RepID=A0A4S4LIQ0_9AGAM|nr:hypothetical protein EW145_g340 [Phellinidium pouzarii]